MKKISVIFLVLLVAGILSACAPQEHRSFGLFDNKVVVQTAITPADGNDTIVFIFGENGTYDVAFSNLEGFDFPLLSSFEIYVDDAPHAEVIQKWKINPQEVFITHNGVVQTGWVY